MNDKILIVEDSKEVYQMIQAALISPLLELSWAKSIEEAKVLISQNAYGLLLLDIGLPDGSGLELCSQIQMSHPELPIFLLTAHDELSEKVMGFSAGADDYITKPFNPLELKARVEAKLKKQKILKQSQDTMDWDKIKINKLTQIVKVFDGSKFEAVDLTALEFKILIYFASRPEEVIKRDDMLDEIWGKDVHVYSRSVDTHVSKLRKKLGDVSTLIESVHGVGYKFTPQN